MLTEINIHNVHVVSSGTLLRTVAWEIAPQCRETPLRGEGKGGARMYMSFICHENPIVKHKKITSTHHKIRHLKWVVLVLFCGWEDVRIWGHLKCFLRCVSSLSTGYTSKAQKVPHLSPSWIPLRMCRPWATAVASGLILVELEWQATFISLQIQICKLVKIEASSYFENSEFE